MNKGDIISTTEYLEVQKTGNAGGQKAVWVKNLETGEEIGITEDIAKGYASADNFSKEEKVSRTDAISILENVGDRPFTVNFNKKPKDEEVMDKVNSLSASDRKVKKKVLECFQGEERTLRGRLLNVEAKLGRSQVIDLDIEKDFKGGFDKRSRLVDHRSINWLVVGGTKYTVKG